MLFAGIFLLPCSASYMANLFKEVLTVTLATGKGMHSSGHFTYHRGNAEMIFLLLKVHVASFECIILK